MATADELKAELRVAELEEQFVAAKESGEVSDELRSELREARREFREKRAEARAALEDGDAVVRPEPVVAAAEVEEVGG